ncbi:ABC transporter ATP-binding protein [Nisaea acidiphila]|uniref:ABC transporter ATP-binding protein n=1 Tax=Nisaea acidiphila TaxID=1862145 RepID=A0A9J7ART7_9PROT|nr:ABC transporter ATP-binding protein [Nisaea acidiphila]UUX49281.1 ABC transporter ATP-binding protein [Nisaea acidiphila]
MLDACEVTASYGDAPVLNGLTASFAAGRLTALVGPNGCGKSTFLKTVMGFMPQSTGTITLDGSPIGALGRRALARRVAYLPQDSFCPDYLALGELVELAGYARYSILGGPSARDRELFRDALGIVGLADLAHKPVSELSGGQRQRAWIAMVLAQDADLILMDEPVNHLDMKYQYAVLELVRELTLRHGKTVVAVLHDLNLTAAFADDVVMLRDGRVEAAGPVGDTVTRANVERVFDFKADIFAHEGRLVCLPYGSGAVSAAE